MKTMTTTKQIEEALLNAAPGTILEIKGYVDSSGATKDIRVQLLESDGYADMQSSDLKILADADSAQLLDGDLGDLTTSDILAAREELLASLRKAADGRAAGSVDYTGADYAYMSTSLARLPDKDPDALYLLRLKALGPMDLPKPAKGAIPKAKQKLKQMLDLPGRRYIHSLKFEDGKFESVTEVLKVEAAVVGPASR